MYERILVPTDGDEQSLAAARHAVELAGVHGATVDAVYVADTEPSWTAVSKGEVRETLREVQREAGVQALDAVETLADGGTVTLRTELREGTPDEEILAAIDDHDPDLVVMGTHGHSGIRRRLLGSVTERIVRDAPVPVLTVKSDTEASGSSA